MSGGQTVQLDNPVINWDVRKDGASSEIAYHYMSDQFSKPILITTYNGGDVFQIKVDYTWFNTPHKDYTVKIYSKQDLSIKDSDNKSVIYHMDGKEPSGFTKSTYRGMVKDWDPSMLIKDEPKQEEEEEEAEYTSLTDLLDGVAEQDGIFLWNLIVMCFTVAPEICFNPLNWL